MHYLLLYIPFTISFFLLYAPAPLQSSSLIYLISWLGSFWIFWLVYSEKVKPLPGQNPLADNLFRPIGFPHLIFIGYNAVTSIFYFLSQKGFYYFSFQGSIVANQEIFMNIAWAQTYCVLAHAALVTGIFVAMDFRESGKWSFNVRITITQFTLFISGLMLFLFYGLSFISGVEQVALRLGNIAFIASVLSLALSLIYKEWTLVIVNSLIYLLNAYHAFTSGWKEEILILFLLLLVFLYPYYKKTVAVTAPLILAIVLFIVPMYVSVFRSLNWDANISEEKSAELTINQLERTEYRQIADVNWEFWTQRATLMRYFVQYIDQVPEKRPHYGFSIVEQTTINLIPRIIWPEKPNMEKIVMQRVYENEVVSRSSPISAKPPFIMDAYLFGGGVGVLISAFVLGILASLASRMAEKWFGGYLIGGGLFFMSLFKVTWKGSAFEFIFPTIFWSFVVMFFLFFVFRLFRIIVPTSHSENLA